MKSIIAKSSLVMVALMLCVQSIVPVALAQQVVTNPPLNFDKGRYERSVHLAFSGKVMGYSTVLIRNGQIVSEVAGGQARNAADGNVKMTTTVPANIGSTIKFVAGIALLQLFERIARRPGGRSMDASLSLPVYTYFPKVWQEKMHPSIKKITFRHLLQHRSGFRGLSAADFGPDGKKYYFDYLRKGVTDSNFNMRDYENANFTIFTYLIPVLNDYTLLDKFNAEVVKNKWDAEAFELHQFMGKEWDKYVTGSIFPKLTPAINPSCNPPGEFVTRNIVWAYYYKSVSDAGKGGTYDSLAVDGYCHTAGGWYISAYDLAAFVANFSATDTLVSAKTRDLMFDDDNANEMLVWSFPLANDKAIEDKFKYKVLPYMGGDHKTAHATILLLPDNYYAVGIVNSDEMGSGSVSTALLGAFKRGIGLP